LLSKETLVPEGVDRATTKALDEIERLLDPGTEADAHREVMVQDLFESVTKAKNLIYPYSDDPGLADDPKRVQDDLFRLSALLVRIDHLTGVWQGKSYPTALKTTLEGVEGKLAKRIREEASKAGERRTDEAVKNEVRAHPDYERAASLVSRTVTRASMLDRVAQSLHEFVWNLRAQSKGFQEYKKQKAWSERG